MLTITIVVGYTGIPIYKMICSQDGHITVSIINKGLGCQHQSETKDCCSKDSPKDKNVSSCCNFDNTFSQLDESTLVSKQQTQTGHILSLIGILVYPFQLENTTGLNKQFNIAHNLLLRQPPSLSFIQVFLI